MSAPSAAPQGTLMGLDIGGTKCTVVKSTAAGEVLRHETFPTQRVQETLDQIFATIAAFEPGPAPIFGIACGSPQDSARGVIKAPPNLPDWIDVPIVGLLVDCFGGRGWLMNDANACALAEWLFGAGRGTRNMLYLTFGTGLGAGLILDGRMYEGTTGDAGELGHFRLAPSGPIGFGKAGSFEGFCSGGGIGQLAQARPRELEGRVDFNRGAIEQITARDVAQSAERGDPNAREIMAESGRRLGQGLALVIDLLNPECIVLGSIYTRCQRLLEPHMQEVLAREALGPSLAACRIVPAALGEELGMYSALAVARYHLGSLQE